MAKQCFDGEQVSAVFIQMGAKSMAEGMAGEAVFPSEPSFMKAHMAHDEECVNGLLGVTLLREEPAHRPAITEPVLCQDVQGIPGKDGVTGGTVFAMGDVYPHIPTLDIAVAQMADLADPQAGGIHEGDHGFLLQIRDSRDKSRHFSL